MIDGIYTAYITGVAGQGMAMFVFKDGKIGGADMIGIVFSGEYIIQNDTLIGKVKYVMPANSESITGVVFEEKSNLLEVPINLPIQLDPAETYQFTTPIGIVNAKFVKNTEL